MRAAVGLVVVVVGAFLAVPSHAAAAPSQYCGTAALSPGENQRIIALSDPATLPRSYTFAALDDLTVRQREISQILAAHKDWRGLFAVGLDGVITDAVVPTQRNESALANPRYAKSLSIGLISRYLEAIHAQWTSGAVPVWWANYFRLAAECWRAPARVAMAGYNAHITVDLAYTVSDARTEPSNAPDFYRIVDSIASNGNVIPERTKQIYNADLWGLWTFYFFGQGLDRVVGAGVASNLLLRAADNGYNTITFANGIALQGPHRSVVEQEILALWQTGEVAFDVLAGAGGLGAPAGSARGLPNR